MSRTPGAQLIGLAPEPALEAAGSLGASRSAERSWMRSGSPVVCGPLLILLVTSACGAGWHHAATVAPGLLPARQQVQVWQHGTVWRWHAVRITTDSLSGIPFFQPLSCDTCRVSLPRPAVDSVRLGNPVAGFWKSVGLIGAGMVGLGVVICWHGCALD